MDENKTWAPDRVEYLVELYERGGKEELSFSMIADLMTARFGVEFTKNKVLGKVHRLGLTPRVVLDKPKPRRNIFDFAGPVCVYPIGHPGDEDFHFCGGTPEPRKPYCTEHAARAYIPQDKNKDLVPKIERKEYYY